MSLNVGQRWIGSHKPTICCWPAWVRVLTGCNELLGRQNCQPFSERPCRFDSCLSHLWVRSSIGRAASSSLVFVAGSIPVAPFLPQVAQLVERCLC